MRVTKLNHSCLLVELPAPVNRTVLIDPGAFSVEAVQAAKLEYLDDIVVTHKHFDHCDVELIKQLVDKFPAVRILGPQEVVDMLGAAGVQASTQPSDGLVVIEASHEPLDPLGPTPQAVGVHVLDMLTHPGDSHHFSDSKPVLALPITAPWGSTINAVKLAAALKPKYIIPVHDYIWRDDWRIQMYEGLEEFFAGQGITFIKPTDGQPFVLDLNVAQPS